MFIPSEVHLWMTCTTAYAGSGVPLCSRTPSGQINFLQDSCNFSPNLNQHWGIQNVTVQKKAILTMCRIYWNPKTR